MQKHWNTNPHSPMANAAQGEPVTLHNETTKQKLSFDCDFQPNQQSKKTAPLEQSGTCFSLLSWSNGSTQDPLDQAQAGKSTSK